MSLKLFRSTGYSSTLMAGETRLPMHPGWMILAVSTWAGFACNVALWRQFARSELATGMGLALTLAFAAAGAAAVVLSVLGWRRTLKRAATLVLLAAALAACAIWNNGMPVDAGLLREGMAAALLPSWAVLLRWQSGALLAGLALLPMLWVCNKPLRRLPGPEQLHVNLVGALLGATLLAAGSWLLQHRAW